MGTGAPIYEPAVLLLGELRVLLVEAALDDVGPLEEALCEGLGGRSRGPRSRGGVGEGLINLFKRSSC